MEAFKEYVNQGTKRSLRKVSEALHVELATLGRWSSTHKWADRIVAMMREEQDASRDAAKREAARMGKQRLRKAQALSDSGILIMSKANLANLDEDAARVLMTNVRGLVETGNKMERLEMGETTEVLAPPKPLKEMSDGELDAYIAMLESV